MIKVLYTTFESELPERIWTQYMIQLPPSFQNKINGFIRWQDRHACLFGKLLLLKGLQEFGLGPGCLKRLKYNRYGKPYLDSNIDFNLSHSGSYILCCISKESKLGIDIEKIRPTDFTNFRGLFSKKEWKQIHGSEDPLELFYKYWTIKESVIKAEGKGHSIPCMEVQISGHNFISLGSKTWYITNIEIDASYSSAIAASVPDQVIDFQYEDFYQNN